MKTKIICIIGRSGSGKTTLAKKLSESVGGHIIHSYTTRELRNSDDHIYSTLTQYKKDIQEGRALATYDSEYGYSYWATKSQVAPNRLNFYVVDFYGFIQVKEFYKDDMSTEVIGLYLNTPSLECITRMIKRGDSLNDVYTRAKIDDRKYRNIFMLCNMKLKKIKVINYREIDVENILKYIKGDDKSE